MRDGLRQWATITVVVNRRVQRPFTDLGKAVGWAVAVQRLSLWCERVLLFFGLVALATPCLGQTTNTVVFDQAVPLLAGVRVLVVMACLLFGALVFIAYKLGRK